MSKFKIGDKVRVHPNYLHKKRILDPKIRAGVHTIKDIVNGVYDLDASYTIYFIEHELIKADNFKCFLPTWF